MNGWLLIVILEISGYANGNTVTQLGPFADRASCYAAIPVQGDPRNTQLPGYWYCVPQTDGTLRQVPKSANDPSHGNDRLGR